MCSDCIIACVLRCVVRVCMNNMLCDNYCNCCNRCTFKWVKWNLKKKSTNCQYCEKHMPQDSTKQDFLCCSIFTFDYACMNTRKSRLVRGKLHHCQKAILERDQLHASPQSSLTIYHMLITSLFCIQWKSSWYLFPVSMLATRNAWDYNCCFVYYIGKKKNADYESRCLHKRD